MSSYSVAEARNKLSELIDRAINGEGVTITRHGTPVVEIKAVAREPGPVTEEDLEWLDAHCYTPEKPFSEDAATLIRRMRDEGE